MRLSRIDSLRIGAVTRHFRFPAFVSRGRARNTALHVNLSFVLHERSSSQNVSDWAVKCRRASRQIRRLQTPYIFATSSGDVPDDARFVLTAHIGAHDSLARAIGTAGDVEPPRVVMIDGEGCLLEEHEFFHAPALLNVPPNETLTVLVAGLVLRPDGASTHLQIEGCFNWPGEKCQAIQAAESLVSTYGDQWLPPRMLWTEPAESLLAGEIA